MKRRGLAVAMAGVILAMSILVIGVRFWPSPSPSGHTARPAPTHQARTESTGIARAITAPLGATNGAEKPSVDEASVRMALASFNERVGKITKEQLEEEQRRMQKAREQMEQVEQMEPVRSIFVDEHGLEWVKLVYPSGEVRYDFSEKEP